MASKRSTVRHARTEKTCRICHKPIPPNTAATVDTEKNEEGEYVSEYACYRCINPHSGRAVG